MDDIRKRLTGFLTFAEGDKLRRKLHEISLVLYKPLYTDAEYMAFLERNQVSFETIHPQSTNHPYYYQMFSVVSQHVQGDCIKQCLDIAIGKEAQVLLKTLSGTIK